MDPVDRDFNEHSRAIDANTKREIFLEELRDQIRDDPDEKARLALLYAEAQGDQFFEWAAEQKFKELTPAYENGWDERPTNREYWNFNDERI